MALNFISNAAAVSVVRLLALTSLKASEQMSRISSGYRVMSSGDDPASLALGATLSAEVKGLEQASINIGSALSLLQTADAAYGVISDHLARIETLAIQAQSDSVTDTDRVKIDTEYQLLLSQIDQLSDTTNFNGITLLGGSSKVGAGTTSFNFRVGTNMVGTSAQNNITVQLDYVNTQILALNSTDLTSSVNADTVLTNVRTAIATVHTSRAEVGANINRMEYADTMVNITRENTEAARSQLMDLDIPDAVAKLALLMVQLQSGFAMLAKANQLPEAVLSLLQR